jgi:anthranilate synthase component 2
MDQSQQLKKIALIDCHDSFTYNLVHLFESDPSVNVEVFTCDKVTLEQLRPFPNVILSPGPGIPANAGIVPVFLKEFAAEKNILGICLGLQAIGEYSGCTLKNLRSVMHGIATPVNHLNNDILFRKIPKRFMAGRYHSWVIDRDHLSSSVTVTAADDNGEIMGIRHKHLNLRGVQFHPESILSEFGKELAQNWIKTLK